MKNKIHLNDLRGQTGRRSKVEDALKRQIARQYLTTDQSLAEIALIYGVTKVDVSNWKKRFSSEIAATEELIITDMTEQESKDLALLKKQNEALKKELEYEQIRNFALETMADLAKTELGIDIRKNFGAKQPKE